MFTALTSIVPTRVALKTRTKPTHKVRSGVVAYTNWMLDGYPRSLERPLPRLPDAYVPRERLPVDVQFEQEERGGQSSVQRWSARGTKHCA